MTKEDSLTDDVYGNFREAMRLFGEIYEQLGGNSGQEGRLPRGQ